MSVGDWALGALGTSATGLEGELGIWPTTIGLLGGLALFLFGMEQLAGALKIVAGERMRNLLAQLTRNRVVGAVTGAFVTAVIQSSSVTTVLVVGFISAGLMTLAQSVGVIMGANIGTTITAQIIAFKVTKLALLMIAVGFGLLFFGRRRTRHYGTAVMGLGLVFFGMGVMGEAMAPLRTYQPFLDAMVRLETPLVGVFVGALFTALIQSSSATTGIVIVLAGQGLLTLPAGISIALGANIGTCVTALLAAIGKPREALRASAVHVLFNVVGVVIWLPFLDQLAQLATWLSPGGADLASRTPRQIANSHTIFNVSNTVLLLGLSSHIARLVERWVPDRPIAEELAVKARYLDEVLLSTPVLALDRVRLEILHLGEHVADMFAEALPLLFHGDPESLEDIAHMDDRVDQLHAQLIDYLGKISEQPLSEEQTEELLRLMETVNSLENIGDVIETNLVALGLQRIELGIQVSEPTRKVIGEFHAAVSRALDNAVQAATQRSREAAEAAVRMKREINRLAAEAAKHQASRLIAQEPNRLPAYTLETDILQNLKRIYYYTKRIARATVKSIAIEG